MVERASFKFPKSMTEETLIADFASSIIPRQLVDGETRETVTRACLAGLFITVGYLIDKYDIDAAQLQDVEKITLSFLKAGWNEAFELRLTKAEQKNREPTEDSMRLKALDQGYERLYEISEQLDRLASVCERLLHSVEKLGERCASVLGPAAEGKPGETPQPRLCPLAARLRNQVQYIEDACGDIDMLVERIEL